MNVEHRPWTAWFGAEGVTIAALGGSGFSGSQVLLATRPSGERFVVKCFGPHVDAGRAAWIHAFMDHARGAGLEMVPRVARRRRDSCVLPTTQCDTLCEDPAGRLWEVVEFLPGRSRTTPTDAEAAAALGGLARLHDAAATFPGHPPRIEPAAGVARRVVGAARILDSPWHLLPRATPGAAAVAARLERAVDTFSSCQGRSALERISAVGPVPLTTQIVLRDVWSDHVLFQDDGRLAGFVDYHAVDRDAATADLARLLGSWDAATAADANVDRWRHALDAYAAVRPLPPRERRLIPWLHASGVICGLDNWFRWLLVDGRTFTDMVAVLGRIDRLIAALPDALACARDSAPARD